MRYVYISPWYVWNLPQVKIQTAKRLIGTACGVSILFFLLGSLTDSSLNYSRYVEFPGMLSMAALVFEIFGVAQFCVAKEKMTNMDFRDVRAKMLISPLFHAALLFCAAIAAFYQIFCFDCTLKDVIVPLCYFFSGLMSLLIFLYYRSLPYRKAKNENAKIGLEDENKAAAPAQQPQGEEA